MRGKDTQQRAMVSYLAPQDRVPADHPLRPVRLMADIALEALSPVFELMYAALGRPSIAPEKLWRALLLQILYTIRSQRMLMEQLQYKLWFRWFVGLNRDEPVWVPTVFSKNRDRLLKGGSAIDRPTTRHAGYQLSQRKRKRIEAVFGWMKTVGMLRKSRHRGVFKVEWVFTCTPAAYNLVRMRNLLFPAVRSA